MATSPTSSAASGAEGSSENDENENKNKDQSNDKLKSTLMDTVLTLERLDVNLFRAAQMWSAFRTKNLFGGQIVGQALVAAGKTVDQRLNVHSLHSYFVTHGNPDKPVLYKVENIRDGKSFSSRSVQAIQDGHPVFIMNASFHKQEESPFQHQFSMPNVPEPEKLPSDKDLLSEFLKIPDTPQKQRERVERFLAREIPFEHRRVDGMRVHFGLVPTEPRVLTWVKANGFIGEGNNQMHACVAAYLSDIELSFTCVLPNRDIGIGLMTSLDHSMWFHAPFRSDEWMLYQCESPIAGNARGLNFGRLWRRDGTLAVSVAQETLIRPKL
ncbi:putative acyl-coenzyme A thioesterase 8 [Apostichopus japonicus]|uniref:Putative acyl-coenzyme A thioesterase 8 n=2 Tax=Stichopus japonicus TaxID=307972 RepID=A0A2G8JY67_STIJA|nr:putative acyl-coenzyme A thioesterase 8 [Apostichopus japonicus]